MIRNSALSIYQLLGAPLKAMIDAESQAALATAEFIERVGFEKGSEGADPNDPNSFGKLRMFTFFHEKTGPDGAVRRIKIEVPLLSLIPIPALQIKDAEIDFSILIVDEVKISNQNQQNLSADNTERKAVDGPTEEAPPPQPFRLRDVGMEGVREIKGTFASTNTNSRSSSLEAQMRVKIRMEQADIPAGLGKLFHIMEQNVTVS